MSKIIEPNRTGCTASGGLALLLLAAGGASSAQSLCPPEECLALATTDNARFTIELLGTSLEGSLVTFTYEVCQNTDAGNQALSHWSIGLLQIDCYADGFGLSDLVVAATLDGVPTIFEVGLDPTTGVVGVKFDEGVEDTGCHVWSVTFDTSVLAGNTTLVPGCVLAATKSGPVANNGYACILGPICVNPPASVCWAGESAWSAGLRYTPRGNWATYTPYAGAGSVMLFAGRTIPAGTVAFSAPIDGMVEVRIELAEGFRFDPLRAEHVKIQDYAVPPSGNPAPGQFAHRGFGEGGTFSMMVPLNGFYGIHVDLEREVECAP